MELWFRGMYYKVQIIPDPTNDYGSKDFCSVTTSKTEVRLFTKLRRLIEQEMKDVEVPPSCPRRRIFIFHGTR